MILRIAMLSSTFLAVSYGQASVDRAKTEFEVASIRANPPRAGFHFASDASRGVADSSNPGMFRCSNCTLATLILKAFDLQNYQFPARSTLGVNTFEVTAKIPGGATPADSRVMLQNLLKERFGLAYHYKDKTMRGYHLVVAKPGSKLIESSDKARSPASEDSNRQRQFGQGQSHTHEGLVAFGGSARYRADHQTTGELAMLLSDQLSLPVDDQTKLPGKYDISLNWAGNPAQSGGNHAGGAWEGGAGHGDHGGGGPVGATGSESKRGEESGPTLFDALQSQLGLKLVPTEQSVARTFVIDHLEQLPTAN